MLVLFYFQAICKSNRTDPVLSTSLQSIPNGNQSSLASITKNNYQPNYEMRPTTISNINMSTSSLIKDTENEINTFHPYGLQSQAIPHRNFYNLHYMNMQSNVDNNFEQGSQSLTDYKSNSDLMYNTDHGKTELVPSDGSSNESIASSRETGHSKWRYEKPVHMVDDQVILPKKGQKKDKDDMFKKFSSRDCV